MMADVTLALGSNLGDRRANLHLAVERLGAVMTVRAQSQIYETRPWGVLDQPDFLNMALEGETDLPPLSLLKFLKRLEVDLGRVGSIRYGPRLIDIDILFYDSLVLDTPALTLPHPKLHERAFVLIPLCDLNPGKIHPVFGKSIADLCAALDGSGVKPYEPDP